MGQYKNLLLTTVIVSMVAGVLVTALDHIFPGLPLYQDLLIGIAVGGAIGTLGGIRLSSRQRQGAKARSGLASPDQRDEETPSHPPEDRNQGTRNPNDPVLPIILGIIMGIMPALDEREFSFLPDLWISELLISVVAGLAVGLIVGGTYSLWARYRGTQGKNG